MDILLAEEILRSSKEETVRHREEFLKKMSDAFKVYSESEKNLQGTVSRLLKINESAIDLYNLECEFGHCTRPNSKMTEIVDFDLRLVKEKELSQERLSTIQRTTFKSVLLGKTVSDEGLLTIIKSEIMSEISDDAMQYSKERRIHGI